MSARKIFNYDNLNESKIVKNLKSDDLFENSISACGCLFYKIIDNQVELLLIKYKDPSWPLLDDFGGVIDTTDISVHQAMVREVSEETNTVISESILNNLAFGFILSPASSNNLLAPVPGAYTVSTSEGCSFTTL